MLQRAYPCVSFCLALQLSIISGGISLVLKEFPRAVEFVEAISAPLRDLYPVEPLGRFFKTNVQTNLPQLEKPANEPCDNFFSTYLFACQ